MQAGRLEVTVVASLEGFARELRTKVEAAAEGVAAKIAVKVDSKGLRKQLKRAVEEASKGVYAKVKVKVEEDTNRLRREVSTVADNAAQGAAVNLPVRLGDDENGSTRSGGGGGGGGLGRLVGRLRGSLRGLLTRVARDPAASTVRVRVAPDRDSERQLGGSLSRIATVALRQLRMVTRSALAPTRGVLRTFVRDMGRIAVTAGRDTGRAFSRAFFSMLGKNAGLVRSLGAKVRLGVATTGDAIRAFAGEARHFLTTYGRDLSLRVRIAGLRVRSTDFRAIGRNMRRLGEEAADALRLAFGGRLGGSGWLEGLIFGPLRDFRVRLRVGADVSRQAARDFATSVRQMATRYRTQFVVGVRMAADSSRRAITDFGRSIGTAIRPYSSAVAARVRVLTEPARTAVTGLARDLRRITSTAARDTRNAVRVAVTPAARAVRDLTRGVATIAQRAGRAATSAIRARVSAEGGNFFTRSLRGVLRAGQALADSLSLNVPVSPDMNRGGRRRWRAALFGTILALGQPAVAALSAYVEGLYALVSAAAPAVGVLGAIPGLVAAIGTAFIGTKVAFSGFGKALKESLQLQQQTAAGGKVTAAQQAKLKQAMDQLSPSARKAVTAVSQLQVAWDKVKMAVSERFFSKVANDIKPLARSVMPLLQSTLGDAAGQMGELAHRGAEFMQTGVFRRDFKTIAGTSNTVIGHLTDGLANLGHASLDFLVASGPFVEQVGAGAERLTQWVRASVQAGRETGSLAKFLDHARQKADQLGRTTLHMIKGFGGMSKAGMDVGNTLLDGLEGTMTRFDRWAHSKPGQAAMKQFYEDSAGTFHELNMLVGDFFRSFGRAARDTGVRDLIRQIRTQLGPALGTFFSSLGHSIGPGLISLISNLATAVGHLSAAGSGLGVLMQAFSGLLGLFNTLMRVVPGANTVLATFLGTMLALKVVGGVVSIVQRLGLSMTGLRSAANGLGPGAIGPQISTWQRMQLAYRGASTEGGRLSSSLGGIRAAARTSATAAGGLVRTVGTGLVGALGGPLGIAIAGATIGLGLLAAKQEQNARAAAAHKERVQSLARALADSKGVIDANVRAQAVQLLQDTQLADGKGRLVDTMRNAGVSLKDLTDAYLEQDGSVSDLRKKMLDLMNAHMEYKNIAGDKASVLVPDEVGKKYKAAADALGSVNGELAKSKRDSKEAADAMKDSGVTGVDSYTRLGGAIADFNDKTKTSDERVQALRSALDSLKGNTMSIHDATARLNQTMLQIDDTMKDNIEHSDGWGKSLVGTDKLVNTSTKNGQDLNQKLEELRDGMLQVSTSAREAADNNLIPLSEAMNTSRDAAESARAKAIELAEALGIPAPAAKALADQMGFIPDQITTLITTEGMPKATAEILGLRTQLASIPPGKGIQIKSPTIEARTQLELLGYSFQRIPGSKNVVVTAPSGKARIDIAALADDIAAAPDKKKVTVQAIIKQAAGDLKSVQQKVSGLPKGKSIEVKTPTKTALSALKDLGYKIKTVDGSHGKTVKITAPNKTPIQQVQAIQGKINSLTGKTVHVTVQYSESGKPSVVSRHANGGILRYAEGGINAIGARVRAFANGAENHIAQIAKGGEWRIWAEDETQGEAYLPLAKSKRKRSKAILDQVAQMFGGMVVYPGQGGPRAFANGAVSLARSSSTRTVTAPRSSAPQGAGALVGGDLNLNIGAVASTGTALEDAMFELRRIRLGGTP
jgi:hypothetical protein